jgi:hypothetical protein
MLSSGTITNICPCAVGEWEKTLMLKEYYQVHKSVEEEWRMFYTEESAPAERAREGGLKIALWYHFGYLFLSPTKW